MHVSSLSIRAVEWLVEKKREDIRSKTEKERVYCDLRKYSVESKKRVNPNRNKTHIVKNCVQHIQYSLSVLVSENDVGKQASLQA